MRDWKFFYSYIIVVWACVSCLSLLLQAIKIFNSKQAAGVSLAAYCVTAFGAILWGTYGAFVLEKPNTALIVNACLSFILAIIIISGICVYGDV